MKCHARREVRITSILFLFLLMMFGPAFAGVLESAEHRNTNALIVEGVALRMTIDRVLKIYPTAVVQREAANCHRNGRAIRAPELTRRVVLYKSDRGDLTMNFEPPYLGSRLTRIYHDRPVDLTDFESGRMLKRLVARYGPYDHVLHRRKMEPAGRIVGFEWRGDNGATLRVVLRNEYRGDGKNLHLSFLARLPVSSSRPLTGLLSQLCGNL